MIDILLLGPVTAHAHGRECRVRGTKQQLLLARLALARGGAVTGSQLIADLWGDGGTGDPAHALHAQVSRLRASIPAEITHEHGAYRMDPTQFRLDSTRFAELCEQGGLVLTGGMSDRAADMLRAALGLWRGPAFAGLPPVPELRAEAARLARLRQVAVADRVDAELALGARDSVVAELSSLVEQHPLFERYWAQLMTALYLSNRAPEAIETFARARAEFAGHLGVEPSGELGRLHLTMLRGQPLEPLRHTSPAEPPTGVGGAAAAHTTESAVAAHSPVDRRGMTDGAPIAGGSDPHAAAGLLTSGPLAAGSLTVGPLTSGTLTAGTLTSGRPELLGALLQQHRAVLLTGPGGIGKTHLLRSVAADRAGRQDCAPLLSGGGLSDAMPLGIFLGHTGTQVPSELSVSAVIGYFTQRRSKAMLIVDNADRLDSASRLVIAHLIRTARLPALLAMRDIAAAPEEIHELYDAGDLAIVDVSGLSAADTAEFAINVLGGPLTPDSLPRVVEVSDGNALAVREVLSGSLRAGRLHRTEHGWELDGTPVPTPRLAQLQGSRFDALSDSELEAAARVAIAGEYPAEALPEPDLHVLVRSGVMHLDGQQWLRLAHPLDREILRHRCPDALWQKLTGDVIRTLGSDIAMMRPGARRRGHVLQLERGDAIDPHTALELAEHALGTFDEPLALRAAAAATAGDPRCSRAHLLAGRAASALGDVAAAEEYFETASTVACSAAETTAVAVARSEHLGVRLHDAEGALKVLAEVAATIDDPTETAHLQRAQLRWTAVAGRHEGAGRREGTGRHEGTQSADAVAPHSEVTPHDAAAPHEKIATGTQHQPDAASTSGLITLGMSAVITGPLDDAHRVLRQLRRVPAAVIDEVPGGAALIDLTGIMALSNTGDVVATRHRLTEAIVHAEQRAPETLGIWEYALAFNHLFSGDLTEAHRLAGSAADHLAWRDVAGLHPAAQALAAATATATGHTDAPESLFEQISPSAAGDPKVVMLRTWTTAWQENMSGRPDDAAARLVDGARWLLAAHHTFFAGMLAHCAVRIDAVRIDAVRMGAPGPSLTDAVAVITDAARQGGGGLLRLIARHGEATLAVDAVALRLVATHARELGLASTAADTWLALRRRHDTDTATASQARRALSRLRGDQPVMALWSADGAHRSDADVSGL